MYSRYGAGAKDILSLDFEIGIDILLCAKNQKDEEMLFDLWMHSYSDKHFEDFKKSAIKPKVEDKDQEEILNDVKKIMGG
ncbi:MAG: hypothetical protein KBT03_03790 [Bacteroidales bacterium]|nr:hypothetical protein [Candidatus Scybalousia scybalohippi]